MNFKLTLFITAILFATTGAFAKGGNESEKTPEMMQKTVALYQNLMNTPLAPSSSAINTLVNYAKQPIDDTNTVMFDFRNNEVIFSFACQHIALDVQDLQYHINSDSESNISSILEMKLAKNALLKSGQRKIYIYYNQNGNIDHIQFGKADYYFE